MSEVAWFRRGVSRRRFLQGAGLGAAAVGVAALRPRHVSAADASPSASPAPPDPGLAGNLTQVTETWVEPEVWRPVGTDPLRLHVVENEGGFRFSYGGKSPGPTIRMRGDETLHARIQNDLGPDDGTSPIGPNPDTVEGYPGPEGAMLATLSGDEVYGEGLNRIPAILRPDWSLGEHLNGVHSAHVTNLHTHGLHVAPGKNDNGTSSDDIFLRIVPAEDAVKISQSPGLYAAYQEDRDEIIDAVADFEFRLDNVMEGYPGPDGGTLSGLPHPPGTYWYHPHSHGATQNQVASGMAGFLIIEGDVDVLVNERIAGDPDAAWDQKTGDYDYRERGMFLQRVFLAPTANVGRDGGSDPDKDPDPDKLKKQPNSIVELVNGKVEPDIITMRPHAVERWRVLNGSVDGAGFMRFAVLVGEFTVDSSNALQRVDRSSGSPVLEPVTVNDYSPLIVARADGDEAVEKAKIWQLAWDGITRVVEASPGEWIYRVKDLESINDGQEPDFDSMAASVQAGNMELCYRRPNELRMGDANRADVFFKAPPLADGQDAQVYTVVSLPTQLHGTPETDSKVIAHVVVSGERVPGGDDLRFDTLLDGLAVHPYELPVADRELQVTSQAERDARGAAEGAYRSRTIRYAGWGANGLPLIDANPEYVSANPEKSKLSYYVPPAHDSTDYTMPLTVDGKTQALPVTGIGRFPSGDLPAVLLPPSTRTMNIDSGKFAPTSPVAPMMLLDTAEEWAVFNQSIDLYSVTPPESAWTSDQVAQYLQLNPELVYYRFEYVDDPPDGAPTSPQPWFGGHRVAYAMTPAQVSQVNRARSAAGGDPWASKGQLQVASRAVDHPFHIHQNPFWLMRVDVPDAKGDYVNILPEPIWADTISIPRNGGRVVFRSRFADYSGEFVDHCHILLHEDNGMMQRVEVVTDPAIADYVPHESVVAIGASVDEANAIYPPPSPAESWRQSLLFADVNNTGQEYPGTGFIATAPSPPTG